MHKKERSSAQPATQRGAKKTKENCALPGSGGEGPRVRCARADSCSRSSSGSSGRTRRARVGARRGERREGN